MRSHSISKDFADKVIRLELIFNKKLPKFYHLRIILLKISRVGLNIKKDSNRLLKLNFSQLFTKISLKE